MQFLHVFTTMQCAAMARVVFVKSVKQVMNNNAFVRPSQINNDAEKGLEMTPLTPAINAGDDYRPAEI